MDLPSGRGPRHHAHNLPGIRNPRLTARQDIIKPGPNSRNTRRNPIAQHMEAHTDPINPLNTPGQHTTHAGKCGPFDSAHDTSNNTCLLTFSDDHSWKTWLYLLKKTDEVFEKFKDFRCEVETLSERKIKTLRFDNGGEYTSKELIAYCKEVGVKRKLNVPYYPEQNGVAERKNRTMEGVRTMLLDQCSNIYMGRSSNDNRIYSK